MAVAIDTSKTANDYASGLKQLLPPGEYFTGEDVDKITLAEAEELARIHAKVDIDFDLETLKEKPGWTLAEYRLILSDAGMVDFEVTDHYRLPLKAGLKCGRPLGDVANVSLIKIDFDVSEQAIFDSLKPELIAHKLSHTRFLVNNLELLV
jgi:hypothetical protein